jgi:hypothetical protein
MIRNFQGIYLRPTAHVGGGYICLVEVETKHSEITCAAYFLPHSFAWCLMNETLLKANNLAKKKKYYIYGKLIVYAPL